MFFLPREARGVSCDWGERFAVKGVLCLTDGQQKTGGESQVAENRKHLLLPPMSEESGSGFPRLPPYADKLLWGLKDRRGHTQITFSTFLLLKSCHCPTPARISTKRLLDYLVTVSLVQIQCSLRLNG